MLTVTLTVTLDMVDTVDTVHTEVTEDTAGTVDTDTVMENRLRVYLHRSNPNCYKPPDTEFSK